MRYVTLALIGLALIAYLLAFGSEGLEAIVFFFPFTMTPYVIIAWLTWTWRSLGSQVICLMATVAYSAWFALAYADATIWRPDPQSPIAFLFVGVYAAPVLFVLWLIAYALEWRSRASLSASRR